MLSRLAFSIAVCERPDILIIDEVLSVGDIKFQQKSFRKIQEFKENGTTIIFVSHDKNSIFSICDRVALLNNGKIIQIGSPDVVMDSYNALLSVDIKDREKNYKMFVNERIQTGSKDVYINKSFILDDQNVEKMSFEVDENINLYLDIKSKVNINDLVIGFVVKDKIGREVFGTNSSFLIKNTLNIHPKKTRRIQFKFKAIFLPGEYTISLALSGGSTHIDKNYQWLDQACYFSVVNLNKPTFVGSCYTRTKLKIINLNN